MTHKLYFLSALTMTALLASACEPPVDEPLQDSCTTGNGYQFIGIVNVRESLTPKPDNDNVTHKQEICFGEEKCKTDESNKTKFCSLCEPGYLICKSENDHCDIDARTDKENCGACGNKCAEGQTCNNGKCEDEQNDTTSCTQNELRCGKNGDILEKCVNNTWEKAEACPNGCEGNKCKDKPDDHETDNVCTAGARRCGSDGKTPELCEANAWQPQSACENGCIGNGECRICQEGAKSCDAEGKHPRVCHNNTWEDQAVCTGNMVCVDGDCGCPEGWQTCEGAEGCFDLANDANNCGACGNAVYNDYYACRDGKMCVANGGGYFPHQPGGECCDPNAKQYIYLGGRPDCQNAETDIFSNKEEKQFYLYSDEDSYPYCLTESDIQHYYPSEKDTCFALKAETSHLTNAEECGVLGNYKACDLKNSDHESVQACVSGRCCLIGDLFYGSGVSWVKIEGIDKKNIKGSDCCSGYAYYYSAPNGGNTTACTDTPNYCKDVCGTDDCSISTAVGPVTCRML